MITQRLYLRYLCYWATVLCVATTLVAETNWLNYDTEACEESAGSSFTFWLNPEDNVYGLSIASSAWIRNTPIFGDAFVSLLSNGIEDSWYSCLGFTIRIMPHWKIAPFVGSGGAYNRSLSSNEEYRDDDYNDNSEYGESYWSGHIEAGVRIWFLGRVHLLEILARYTWSSLGKNHDYWLVGLATLPGL